MIEFILKLSLIKFITSIKVKINETVTKCNFFKCWHIIIEKKVDFFCILQQFLLKTTWARARARAQ